MKGNRRIVQKFQKQNFAKRRTGKCINKNSELHSNVKNDTEGGKKKKTIDNRSITNPSSSVDQTNIESLLKKVNKLDNVTNASNSTDVRQICQDQGKQFMLFHKDRCP